MSARRQLLAIDDFIVFDPVKILDSRDFVVPAAFVEPQRRRIAFLRRRLDQKHAPALPPDLILDEAEQQLPDALTLLFGIDGDPVQVEYAVGVGRGAVADVALHELFRSAVGVLEDVDDVLALFGMFLGGIDQIHRAAHFVFREAGGGDEDLVDAPSVAQLGRTYFHERCRVGGALISDTTGGMINAFGLVSSIHRWFRFRLQTVRKRRETRRWRCHAAMCRRSHGGFAGPAGSVGCPRLRQQWRKNVSTAQLLESAWQNDGAKMVAEPWATSAAGRAGLN